ncbi:hypothetical protein BGX26_006905, partial [Mortierella sp. AD094]
MILIDVLKQNRRLRRLKFSLQIFPSPGVVADNIDVFSNLHFLERLELTGYTDLEEHDILKILRPIAPTLVYLRLRGVPNLWRENSADGLVFPSVKEFVFDRYLIMYMNVSQVCPNLETLRYDSDVGIYVDYGGANSFSRLFRCGACPRLKNISLGANKNNQSQRQLARILDCHPGLEGLELELSETTPAVRRAVKRHARTLKSLAVNMYYWNEEKQFFVISIIKPCTRLASLKVNIDAVEPIDWLFEKKNWKNTNSLESLELSGRSFTVRNISLDQRTPYPVGVTPEKLSNEPHFGWKVHGGKLVQNLAFLEALFDLAKEFSRLRTITLNRVV